MQLQNKCQDYCDDLCGYSHGHLPNSLLPTPKLSSAVYFLNVSQQLPGENHHVAKSSGCVPIPVYRIPTLLDIVVHSPFLNPCSVVDLHDPLRWVILLLSSRDFSFQLQTPRHI